jgi:VanZ family protein
MALYHTQVMRSVAYWLPPVVWMGVILWLSTDAGSTEHTSSLLLPILKSLLPWATPAQLDALHHLVRAGAHPTEYGILAALWFRAFARGQGLAARTSAWSALAIALGWAFLDELLQSTTVSRNGSAMDVVIDAAGTVCALTIARCGWRASVELATVVLLWIAAIGGATALAANALAGVASGVLWLTTPAAALGLLARRRLWR